MEDKCNAIAKEFADTIAAVLADDPRIAALRAKARQEGFGIHLQIEANIGFKNCVPPRPPQQAMAIYVPPTVAAKPGVEVEFGSNDRRFLRSLRIAADVADKEVE